MFDQKKNTTLLGVLHLDRLRQRCLAQKRGEKVGQLEDDLSKDRIVLSGLGLPLEVTIRYLNQYEPTLVEFEKWILEMNGGTVEQSAIDRINCALTGRPYGQKSREWLDEIDAADDVLTPDDLSFWQENGYVIARGAIPLEDARAAEEAVWEFLQMSPHDRPSWYEKPIGKGIMTELYHHPALSRTRNARGVHKAFAQVWNTSDLWVTIDRTSFNPPETERYKFQGPRLHWDMSLAEPHYFGTQGILYLCDTAADQGAFSCIPGFHNELQRWLTSLPPGSDPRQVDLNHRAVCISASAGDLIIWHQDLPHGSSPNRANYPRIAQYINMFPANQPENTTWL